MINYTFYRQKRPNLMAAFISLYFKYNEELKAS